VLSLLLVAALVPAQPAEAPPAAPAAEPAVAADPAVVAEPVVEPAPVAPVVEEVQAQPVEGFATPEAAAAPVVTAVTTDAKKEDGKPWSAGATGEYRRLAVWDETAANNHYVLWKLRGSYKVPLELPLPVDVRLALGLTENFVSDSEVESGWLINDTALSLHTKGDLDLASLGAPRPVSTDVWLGVYLPTSRASQNQDLYAAPMLRAVLAYEVLSHLSVSFDGNAMYHFHQYAERAGLNGGMNTQFSSQLALAGEWTQELPAPLFGDISVGADLNTSYERHYASRESYESEASSQAIWQQAWGWDAWVAWTPMESLTASLSLERGAPVLRDGIVNLDLGHRDEIEVVASIDVTY
jgi:hypothetical protein